MVVFALSGGPGLQHCVWWKPGDNYFYAHNGNGFILRQEVVAFTALSSTQFTPSQVVLLTTYKVFPTGKRFVAFLFGTGSSNMEVGSYTGDGTVSQDIVLPFEPSLVFVWGGEAVGGNLPLSAWDITQGVEQKLTPSTAGHLSVLGAILTVGNSGLAGMNEVSVPYHYAVFR